jgi:hypothetical protein
VIVQFSVDGFDTQPTRSFQAFNQNNFYGNDHNRARRASPRPGVSPDVPFDWACSRRALRVSRKGTRDRCSDS